MMQFFESIAQQFNKTFIVDDRYMYFLNGLKNTIITALAATLMGIVIGIIILAAGGFFVLTHLIGKMKNIHNPADELN